MARFVQFEIKSANSLSANNTLALGADAPELLAEVRIEEARLCAIQGLGYTQALVGAGARVNQSNGRITPSLILKLEPPMNL
jgi:hypothetical protein